MQRKSLVDEKLKAIGAEVGDTIAIISKGDKQEGILMPHHAFSSDDTITIKLKSGYNIGIVVDQTTEITVVQKHREIAKVTKKTPQISYDPKKPTVAIIGTGGTIACYVDYRTGAVYPATSAQDLAFSVPEIFEICNVKARIAFQIFSEDFTSSQWKSLAHDIAGELNNGAHGVVIPHGTDTMGYTAAALSFMVQNLSGPVVLVGAQRSSDRPSSDATQNLLAAVTLAARSDIGEVVITMHGDISDTFTTIHRGTKARKFHTSRRDAFKTVNAMPLGKIENGEIKITEPYRKATNGKVTVDDHLVNDIDIVYSYPGLKPEDIPDKKGIVLVGTGLGHVPSAVIPRIQQLIDRGSVVVMTSQCIFGRINMNVYSTGRDLLKAGVISGEDMLPETAFVKLMWALAHGQKREDIEKLMLTNIAGEISEKTRSDAYL